MLSPSCSIFVLVKLGHQVRHTAELVSIVSLYPKVILKPLRWKAESLNTFYCPSSPTLLLSLQLRWLFNTPVFKCRILDFLLSWSKRRLNYNHYQTEEVEVALFSINLVHTRQEASTDSNMCRACLSHGFWFAVRGEAPCQPLDHSRLPPALWRQVEEFLQEFLRKWDWALWQYPDSFQLIPSSLRAPGCLNSHFN